MAIEPEALLDELIRLQNLGLACILYRHDPQHLSDELRKMRSHVNKLIGAINDVQGNILLREPGESDQGSDIRS